MNDLDKELDEILQDFIDLVEIGNNTILECKQEAKAKIQALIVQARIDELQDAVIKSGGVNPLLAKYVSDRVAELESKDE